MKKLRRIFNKKKKRVEIIPLDLFKFGHEFVFPFISLLYSSANL